jgi:hypothetical protein
MSLRINDSAPDFAQSIDQTGRAPAVVAKTREAL